ncbi:MAG: hypothetical protein U0929_15315 [Planctomycetaceae bacterium]
MVGQRVLIDSRNLAPTVTPEGGPEPAENPVEGLDLFGLLERYSFSRTNLNQRSVDQMFYSVNLLNRFHGGIVLADELSELLLGRFVKWLQMEAYLPSTVKRNLNNISTLWKWGYKRRLCRERFEQLDPIRIPKAIPTAWTLQELARILGACRQLKGRMRDGCKRSDWWESLILVLYDTGARIRAAMCLRRSDINSTKGMPSWVKCTLRRELRWLIYRPTQWRSFDGCWHHTPMFWCGRAFRRVPELAHEIS